MPELAAATMVEDEIARLSQLLAEMDEVRSAASRDRNYGFNQPWAVFARAMRVLNPQSYGGRVERWLTRFYGWTKVASTADRGDALTADGAHVEVKVTFITASNTLANFVQIRPHQSTDSYELFVVDTEYEVTRFTLTKAQMLEELDLVGSSAHGTATAVAGNSNREYAIRFAWDPADPVRARWEERYVTPSDITAGSTLPPKASSGKRE